MPGIDGLQTLEQLRHLLPIDRAAFVQGSGRVEGSCRGEGSGRCRTDAPLCRQPACQRRRQIRRRDRLGEIVVHAGRQACRPVAGHRRGREGDDRETQPLGPDGTGRFEAVHLRHVAIHENQVEGSGADGGHRLEAVVDDGCVHSQASQQAFHQPLVCVVVLGNEHARSRQLGAARPAFADGHHRPGLGVRGRFEDDGEPERGAAARTRIDVDLAAHHFDEFLAEGKAESGATKAARGRSFGLNEGFEDPVLLKLADADTCVGDLEAQGRLLDRPADGPGSDDDTPARGELDGVSDEIGHYLAEPVRVAGEHKRDRAIHFCGQGDAFLSGAHAEQGHDGADERRRREADPFELHVVGLDLGEVQNVVDDRQQRLTGAFDGLDAFGFGRPQGRVAEQAHVAKDRVHGRPHLMAHHCQEGALGLIGGFGRRRFGPQALFSLESG